MNKLFGYLPRKEIASNREKKKVEYVSLGVPKQIDENTMLNKMARAEKPGPDLRNPKSDCDLLARAKSIVSGYQLKITSTRSDEFIGSAYELPLVLARGSAERIIEATRDALICAVCVILQEGGTPPEGGRRDIQVNVRMSAVEKDTLETVARARGYRGISDYLRSIGLDAAHRSRK